MTNPKKFPRTLVLYPTRRGLAFAVFTAPLSVIDWGTKRAFSTTKDAQAMRAAEKLIERCRPDVLILEDMEERGSRRAPRIRKLNRLIAHLAAQKEIEIACYSRRAIQVVFSTVEAKTKYEINFAIAALIPALSAYQPNKRRAWDDEPVAQGAFDAVALGLTYFAGTGRLDLAQALCDDDAPPLSVHSVRTPYRISPTLPTLELCA